MTFDLEHRRSDTHIPEIVRRLQEAAYMRDDLWKQWHWKTMARDLLDDAASEIMRLRGRLELGCGQDAGGVAAE